MEGWSAIADGFDLAVVGSGAAGFAAAIAARRLDKTVVMIEAGTVGGTCVNTGMCRQRRCWPRPRTGR